MAPDIGIGRNRGPKIDSPQQAKPRSGVYGGSHVRFLEHEVTNWIRGKIGGQLLADPEHPRLITVRETEQRTGLSRVHRWRLEKQGRFPRRVRLGGDEGAGDAA